MPFAPNLSRSRPRAVAIEARIEVWLRLLARKHDHAILTGMVRVPNAVFTKVPGRTKPCPFCSGAEVKETPLEDLSQLLDEWDWRFESPERVLDRV